MAVLNGWYALGTGVSSQGVFQECTTYTRPAVNLTGTALSGLTQNLGQITGPTGPNPGTITKGAIFDSVTGGNCLFSWDWNLLTVVPANFLALTINITLMSYISTALNMALVGGPGTTGSLIDSGAQVGFINGQPLIAMTRMTIAAGGSLIPHYGSGSQFNNADVTGALNFQTIASGNILTNITALAGGANSASTPVLTGFANRATTVATSLDSVALPSPSVAPVGTLLLFNTSGAAAAAVFPDTGASLNSGSANASVTVPIGKSALFFRDASLHWFSIISA